MSKRFKMMSDAEISEFRKRNKQDAQLYADGYWDALKLGRPTRMVGIGVAQHDQ